MKQARINVLVVTYKQADVIGRNIESILVQKEFGLNEIVICDDCSPDNNWDVIQRYVEKYPQIIRAYRNDTNLGIYGNSNKLVTLCGEADLYCWLEGDDALCNGFFKTVQEYIHKKQIDLLRPLGLFCDYFTINTEGDKSLVKNDFVKKGYNPFGAYLRLQATWRASLFTQSVITQFKPVELNKGLILAETLFDSQWFRFIEKGYYIPIAGSIYYAGLGVSITWNLMNPLSSYNTSETIDMWKYLIKNKIVCESSDVSWAHAKISYARCIMRFSFRNLTYYIFYYLLGIKGYNLNFRLFLSSILYLLRIKLT